MPKQPPSAAVPRAALDAARSAARNTDSGPARPAPPAAGRGDVPAQKAIETQTLAAALPANPGKPLEYETGGGARRAAPQGAHAKPVSRLPTGSTPSEANRPAKTGDAAAIEAPAANGHTLEFVKDQYRHRKTILALGASQGLLPAAGIPMALPDGSHDPGLILADAANAAEAAADFIAAVGLHRHLARESDPPRV